MRVFYGVALPQEVRLALSQAADHARAQLPGRYALPAHYHCTLAFVGEVEPGQLSALKEILEGAAMQAAPATLSLTVPGYFGRRENAILWYGMAGAETFVRVSHTLQQGLHAANLPCDDKPFRAHITLARQIDLTGFDLQQVQAPALSWQAEEIALFESRRRPEGMAYVPLFQCKLSGK